MSRSPLLKDPSWTTNFTKDDVEYELLTRVDRLKRAGIEPFDPCLSCALDHDPEDIEASKPRSSPLLCNAACWFGQQEFERNTIEQIAVALSGVFGKPYFVTITRHEQIPVADLPTYNWDGLRQSVKRNLAKLKQEHNGRVSAVGRVDFDLAAPKRGELVVRPHMHLIVVGPQKGLVRETLRPAPVRNSQGKRLIFVQDVKDQGALRYALKCMLQGVPKGEAAGQYRHSRERPPVAAELAFEEFLSRHTVNDLLLMFGLRRYGAQVTICRDLDPLKKK